MNPSESASAERRGLMLRLECRLARQGEVFLASCERLGVSDQGRTEAEARHNLQISLTLFLREFAEQAVLEQVLKERGVQYTSIRADRVLPGVMDDPQVLAEVDVVGVPSVAAVGRNEIRSISVPAYLWAAQGSRPRAV